MTFHVIYSEGNIFDYIGNWVRKHVSEFWQKPLVSCPVCMTFWYGFFFHWFVLDTELHVAFVGSILGIGLTALVVGFYKNDDDTDKKN
jgi:hypothetical protein